MVSPTFEIHLEEWNHALHIDGRGHKSDVIWLLQTLKKYGLNCSNVQIFALHDWINENFELCCEIGKEWNIKSHGIHHYYDEEGDRSPYFNKEGLPFPPSGGFFFRIMPLWYLKWAIKKSGIFWIHPHDLDEDHPKLKNSFMNWKRHIGLKGAKKKLERLLSEIRFQD